MDKRALHAASYGVYIVTAEASGKKAGCVINTFVQVTSTPARVTVALNKDNATTAVVSESGRFEVALLAKDAPMDLIGRFGFHTSTAVDKFADTQWTADEHGVPYVSEHAVAHVGARVIDTVDVGTHLVFVGEVDDAEVLADGEALTYAYYRQVKGGKTPPKASSYDADDSSAAPGIDAARASVPTGAAKTSKWRCQLCGYEVEVEGDELPPDFKCPLCGAGRDLFTRIA
jgi:flavin reductase (DIM6/NTAB) family NADH-FMN oxidoreductase RutF/rubredoxin